MRTAREITWPLAIQKLGEILYEKKMKLFVVYFGGIKTQRVAYRPNFTLTQQLIYGSNSANLMG